MKHGEKKLLMALANGMLLDYQNEKKKLENHRKSLVEAIGLSPDNPLMESRVRTLEKIKKRFEEVDSKIAALSKLIEDAR